MNKSWYLAAGLLLASSAWAASFNARLDSANALLRRGDADTALDVYRDLLLEKPDSLEAAFGAGCAEYARAMNHALDSTTAASGLDTARTTFEEVAEKARGVLRERAEYNAANATAQKARRMLDGGSFEQAMAGLRESASAYEKVLSSYPGHDKARHNLDHVRYLIKTMLQTQQDQQRQGEQPEEEGDNQENGKEAASKSAAQEKESGQEEEQQSQQQPSPSTSSEIPEGKPYQAQPSPDINQENMEAILQSLEEMDRKEQQERFRTRIRETVPQEWW